ncbi:MAG: polyketide cyclase [Polyangiaceae bacterium]|nr:polyketide cyclase [Polyangiaceae bacterium]
MKHGPVTHETITIERTYPHAPEKVFAAWADPKKKRRWFAEGEGFGVESYEVDFRVGGHERTLFRGTSQPPMTNETYFHDIVENRRIVMSYAMTMDGRRFSVSLATIEIEPSKDGSRMLFTEQAAFLEGADGPEMRRAGWTKLFEQLDGTLKQS